MPTRAGSASQPNTQPAKPADVVVSETEIVHEMLHRKDWSTFHAVLYSTLLYGAERKVFSAW
jgi:hypothetical protein